MEYQVYLAYILHNINEFATNQTLSIDYYVQGMISDLIMLMTRIIYHTNTNIYVLCDKH